MDIYGLLLKAGFSPHVVIVPLGVKVDAISQVVEKIDEVNKPKQCKIASSMPDLQEQMQIAIYNERKYIWDYKEYENLYDYFCQILEI